MEMTRQQTVTRLLEHCRDGNRKAVNELFEILYEDLYKVARSQRLGWKGNETLNTTGLIHEAYLKLVDQTGAGGWKSKAHFLATASSAMRHILINYARDSNRLKRGGNLERVSLQFMDFDRAGKFASSELQIETLITLGDALQQLDEMNPRLSQIIECRIFGGMTIEETAEALEISPITVTRGWETARLWLNREMQR